MNFTETVLANTYTKTEFIHRLALLKRFLEQLTYGGGGLDNISDRLAEFLSTEEVDPTTASALTAWGEDFYRQLAGSDPYAALADLEAEVLNRPILTLTVPADLSTKWQVDLGRWVKEHINSQVLIELDFDPDLIAGCRLSWRGRQYDLSFSQKRRQNRQNLARFLAEFFKTKSA